VRHHLAQIGGVTAACVNPTTGSVLLEYDPNILSPVKVIELLVLHGCVPSGTEVETETRARWADRLASVAMHWVINAAAERLALAMITALA
jgi:hypothetical protein